MAEAEKKIQYEIDNDMKLDWSTQDLAQKWFNNFGVMLSKSLDMSIPDYTPKEIFGSWVENGMHISAFGYTTPTSALIELCAGVGKSGVQCVDCKYEIMVWSKQNVLIKNTYSWESQKGKKFVQKSHLMVACNDKQKITHWVYTWPQAHKDDFIKYAAEIKEDLTK
eukprot:159829_1